MREFAGGSGLWRKACRACSAAPASTPDHRDLGRQRARTETALLLTLAGAGIWSVRERPQGNCRDRAIPTAEFRTRLFGWSVQIRGAGGFPNDACRWAQSELDGTWGQHRSFLPADLHVPFDLVFWLGPLRAGGSEVSSRAMQLPDAASSMPYDLDAQGVPSTRLWLHGGPAARAVPLFVSPVPVKAGTDRCSTGVRANSCRDTANGSRSQRAARRR